MCGFKKNPTFVVRLRHGYAYGVGELFFSTHRVVRPRTGIGTVLTVCSLRSK